MFDKLAYFLNDEIETINAYAGLKYDKFIMAKMFSQLPHMLNNMPIADYWEIMEISNAKNEIRENSNNIKEAWGI